jgi:hypothetical protein
LIGLSLIGLGKRELQSRIPYGPHIALAAMIWMLAGQEWTKAYIRWVLGG